MESRRLSARKLIFERDNHTCYLCGKKFKEKDLHVDHVFPYSKGGATTLKNLKTACKSCNLKKHDREDFSLVLDFVSIDPKDGSVYINRDILNHFDPGLCMATVKLLLNGELPGAKVGIPEGEIYVFQ